MFDGPFYYILKDKQPVACRSLLQWGQWWEGDGSTDHRIVKKTTMADVEVSTVFLGLDLSWSSGPPILFETMVFGGEHDEECWRCCTWDEAEQQHRRVVRDVIGLKAVM